jgi:hypothetical protein
MLTQHDVLREGGGPWLGAIRNWIQCKKKNGERVTWGSSDVLEPHMTMKEIEEICAVAVAAERNERERAVAK